MAIIIIIIIIRTITIIIRNTIITITIRITAANNSKSLIKIFPVGQRREECIDLPGRQRERRKGEGSGMDSASKRRRRRVWRKERMNVKGGIIERRKRGIWRARGRRYGRKR